MVYRLLADAVMVAHFAFLVFLALGGFLAWRYRWVFVPHAAAVGWAMLSIAGAECPLTGWEDGRSTPVARTGAGPQRPEERSG